ncbi:hypothetical protein D2E76_26395 [Mycobacteroides abscessus]|uniref:Bacteriophage protein n=1 Tax=Mycobacteroides abscessus TaxID=36809 RepID=A0ABD7HGT5_9MYCO|nr:hypothetical protein [Mycobacteroides abscessus]RIT28905.1 hypothetical protein D2E76_26395 [Mycobacteroides abscessus]
MAGVTGWWAETIIEPEPAALTLTGGVPVVEVTNDIFIEPTPAQMTLTGGQPSITTTITPTGGALTLTGGVPNVVVGNTITPTSASLTLTGGVPTVTVTNNNFITPTPASLTLTGGVPTVSVLTPVLIDQVGTPGSESTGNVTCTANYTSGADVLVFAWGVGSSSSCYQADFSGYTMRFLGRTKFNGGQLAAWVAENFSGSTATITVSKSGFDWAQCVAVSYTGAAGFKLAKIAKGSGTSASQSASPGPAARAIQSFTRAGTSGSFTSLSGGTNRINDSANLVTGTVSDTNTSGTFSASITSSSNWGSMVIEATPQAITTPRVNCIGALWTESNSGSAQTFTVRASAGDYIIVDMAQSANGDPSSVTCAGTTMTLIDTAPFTHPNTGSGFLKRYRSAQQGSAGDKTVSITATSGQWWHAAGVSVSGAASFGTPTKTSGTSSAPSQSATCSAGQLVLQSFVTAAAPTDLNCTNLFDSPGGSQVYLLMNAAEETTTFSATGSTNWGAIATVIT